MGFDDCLRALLRSSRLQIEGVVSREYKIVLGQALQQHEAGGRSALMLAIESGRQGAVELLLGGHDTGTGRGGLSPAGRWLLPGWAT